MVARAAAGAVSWPEAAEEREAGAAAAGAAQEVGMLFLRSGRR